MLTTMRQKWLSPYMYKNYENSIRFVQKVEFQAKRQMSNAAKGILLAKLHRASVIIKRSNSRHTSVHLRLYVKNGQVHKDTKKGKSTSKMYFLEVSRKGPLGNVVSKLQANFH